jgi:hypothetical protein
LVKVYEIVVVSLAVVWENGLDVVERVVDREKEALASRLAW